MNISKETTFRELSKIRGIPMDIQRQVSINLTGGKTNAYEIAAQIHNMPPMVTLLEEFRKEKNIAA